MSSEQRMRAGRAVAYASLVGISHIDLTRRDASQIKGPKALWRIVTLIPLLGPALYFMAGRTR